MTATVTIYSDLHCPWATMAVHRLRDARDRLDADVEFDQRAWPLEWVNEQGTPRNIVVPETSVLAAQVPDLFSYFRGDSWPSTFLPAFELVAAARRVGGLRAAEDVDYQVRRRFFRHSADVSLRHELHRAATDAGVDAGAAMKVWEQDPVRADVVADYAASQDLSIEGSPQIFWPDGATTHNPGVENLRFERGIPRFDSIDPGAPERLLRKHCEL
ncbi:dithiol-disulfide isomerase [soil metagenome]